MDGLRVMFTYLDANLDQFEGQWLQVFCKWRWWWRWSEAPKH